MKHTPTATRVPKQWCEIRKYQDFPPGRTVHCSAINPPGGKSERGGIFVSFSPLPREVSTPGVCGLKLENGGDIGVPTA